MLIYEVLSDISIKFTLYIINDTVDFSNSGCSINSSYCRIALSNDVINKSIVKT